MTGVAGIEVIGGLPEAVQIVTTFSAACAATSTRADDARHLLAFLASPATAQTKRQHGMTEA